MLEDSLATMYKGILQKGTARCVRLKFWKHFGFFKKNPRHWSDSREKQLIIKRREWKS
jgi:hypothetical protein